MSESRIKYHNHSYKHQHDGHGHNHNHAHIITNKKKLIIVIFFNLIITIAEYIGGILSGSLALISDAGHNLSDVLSLVLGYAGEKISEKKGNKQYTFGLKRFEVLMALVNAFSLLLVGIYIIYEAFHRFFNPVSIDIKIMLPVAFVGLAGNIFSILVLMKNKDTTINMKAAFMHMLYDAISSVFVILAGIILYFTNILWIDLAMSLFIVVMIFWSSFGIISETIRIFLQGAPKNIDIDAVSQDISSVKFVESAHCLHIWSVSSSELFLSCHLLVKSDVLGHDAYNNILEEINEILEHKYNITHTTIQIENLTCKSKYKK